MKRSYLMALVFLGLFLCGASLSPNPSPRPTKEPNETPTFGNYQGQQQKSPVSSPGISQSIQQNPAAATEQQHSGDGPTRIIIIFSIISSLAAVAMAWFNCQLVGITRSLHAAAQAAEEPLLLAADPRSEEEAASPQFVEVMREIGSIDSSVKTVIEVKVRVQIKNHGKGTARIEGTGARPHYSQDRMYKFGAIKPPIIQNRFRTSSLSISSEAIGPFEQADGFIFRTWIPDPYWTAMMASQIRLSVFGFISYSDVFKRSFRHSFRLSYVPPQLKLIGGGETKSLTSFMYLAPKARRQRKTEKS